MPTNIVFAEVDPAFPAARGNVLQGETLTASAANQATAYSIPSPNNRPAAGHIMKTGVYITSDVSVNAVINSTPNALTDTTKRILVLAGQTSPFYILQPGEKVAVVLA